MRDGALEQIVRVGRVEENEVEFLAQGIEIGHRVAADDLRAFLQPRERQILTDELHRVGAPVHEHGALRAARKCLDAELSRPREEVEHARALHLELDGGENALLDLVGGRAGIITL